MADTNFTPGTVVSSSWLNEVNDAVYTKLPRLPQPQDRGTVTAATSFGLGTDALASNTGIGNLAIGYQAMPVNVTGQFSTALGINTQLFYTGLGFNTTVGYGAYARGLTGYNNVAIGFETIHDNGTGTDNVAIGSAALHSGTNAVSGSAPADPSSCVAIGSQALKFAYGSYNVAIGANAVNNNTPYVSASSIVAVGESAFQFITSATQCVGIGRQVGLTKTTGNHDTLVGFQSGYSLGASGGFNTFLGSLSGYYCPGSIQSTYIGYLAGQGKIANTGGGQNVGIGASAMELCGDVVSEVAVGFAALRNVTGNGNTAIGNSALTAETTGINNTAVGNLAASAQTVGFSNTTSLGYQATATASNQVTLGNSSVATLRCQVTSITALSDERDKKDIQTLESVLPDEFLYEVQLVAYRWAMRDGTDRGNNLNAGIIAQQLQALQDKYNVHWLNLVDTSNPDKLEATPGNLLFPLILQLQKQKKTLDSILQRLENLEANG